MSTPTPRTHARASEIQRSGVDWHASGRLMAEFARQLERELEEAREEIGSLKAQAIELHMKACQLTAHKAALVKARDVDRDLRALLQ